MGDFYSGQEGLLATLADRVRAVGGSPPGLHCADGLKEQASMDSNAPTLCKVNSMSPVLPDQMAKINWTDTTIAQRNAGTPHRASKNETIIQEAA